MTMAAPASFLKHPEAFTSQTKSQQSSTHKVMIRDACIVWFTHSFNANFGSVVVGGSHVMKDDTEALSERFD
jgi:hypothetical protein